MSVAGEWRPVPGYYGYEVRHDGRVRSLLSTNSRLARPFLAAVPRELRPQCDRRGGGGQPRVDVVRKRGVRVKVAVAKLWSLAWPELAERETGAAS
jgi:hypothetical protein